MSHPSSQYVPQILILNLSNIISDVMLFILCSILQKFEKRLALFKKTFVLCQFLYGTLERKDTNIFPLMLKMKWKPLQLYLQIFSSATFKVWCKAWSKTSHTLLNSLFSMPLALNSTIFRAFLTTVSSLLVLEITWSIRSLSSRATRSFTWGSIWKIIEKKRKLLFTRYYHSSQEFWQSINISS